MEKMEYTESGSAHSDSTPWSSVDDRRISGETEKRKDSLTFEPQIILPHAKPRS